MFSEELRRAERCACCTRLLEPDADNTDEGRKTNERNQKSEVRSQKSEVRSQKSEIRSQKRTAGRDSAGRRAGVAEEFPIGRSPSQFPKDLHRNRKRPPCSFS